jgi:hypothetical protein
MRVWEIFPRVNSPKNDDPSLWEPLRPEPTQTTTDALELLYELAHDGKLRLRDFRGPKAKRRYLSNTRFFLAFVTYFSP